MNPKAPFIPGYVLPVIVLCQFLCTSLWFAGNAVMPELTVQFELMPTALGQLTTAVQLGFILGTLLFALFSLADRVSPSRLFMVSALLGAACNLSALAAGNTFFTLWLGRFGTGFFLAGIYPVGMKIAADYFEKGLGRSLGFLVGALVLGTAFPHLLKSGATLGPWNNVLWMTSGLAAAGGLLLWLIVPDGPHRRAAAGFDPRATWRVFGRKPFRSAALGYFGHMWELYAFWAFVPVFLMFYNARHGSTLAVPLWSFVIIGSGFPACVAAGMLSQKWGARRVARGALLLSGLLGLLSPLLWWQASMAVTLVFLVLWGMAVVADSPMFSTVVAQNAPPQLKGTALTVVNSLGFAITIVSIQLLSSLQVAQFTFFLGFALAIGPAVGWWLSRKS